jgi:hypothetical protein
MSLLIGAIADDFTGGTDLHGVTTRLASRRTLTWTKGERSRGSTHLGRLGSREG